MTKAQYRKQFSDRREELDKTFTKDAAAAFFDRFFSLFSYENLKDRTVMVYSSFGNEAGTKPLIDGLKKAGAKVVLPKVDGPNIAPYYYESPEHMKAGCFGISEPDPEKSRLCDPSAIDIIVVPGLAFDENGGRLGFGKGYYDRFLPKTRSDALKIGLCYSFQFLSQETLPIEAHDVPMDMILTEDGFFNCKKCSCKGR